MRALLEKYGTPVKIRTPGLYPVIASNLFKINGIDGDLYLQNTLECAYLTLNDPQVLAYPSLHTFPQFVEKRRPENVTDRGDHCV
jgi:hypothetical protein